MNMDHKSGDITYVDFAGKKMHIVDPDTGEITEAEGFCIHLGCKSVNVFRVYKEPESGRMDMGQ